jgi:hypothetical protein
MRAGIVLPWKIMESSITVITVSKLLNCKMHDILTFQTQEISLAGKKVNLESGQVSKLRSLA